MDMQLSQLIHSYKSKHGEVVIQKEMETNTQIAEEDGDIFQQLQNRVNALSKETIQDFLLSSILSKKEINTVYDYINQGEEESAKTFIQYTTLTMAEKNRACELISEWPKDVRLTLDRIDPKNKEDIEEHKNWKDFGDGTFEMIPEFAEQPKRDMVDDLHKKVRLLNGGNNLIEFIKHLPLQKSNKFAMFKYIEKRHPERIPPFCEYLGLSEK